MQINSMTPAFRGSIAYIASGEKGTARDRSTAISADLAALESMGTPVTSDGQAPKGPSGENAYYVFTGEDASRIKELRKLASNPKVAEGSVADRNSKQTLEKEINKLRNNPTQVKSFGFNSYPVEENSYRCISIDA